LKVLYLKSIVCLCFFILPFSGFTISLKEFLNTDLHDTSKVIILNEKLREIATLHKHKAIILGKEALKISQEANFERGQALSYTGIGIVYHHAGSYKEALFHYYKALNIYKNANDILLTATLYANIGSIYHLLLNYEKALDNYSKSLNLSINNGLKARTANTLGSLGVMYYDKGEYATALRIYLMALKLREELNDKQGIAYTLSNIGLLYDDMGQYKSALHYLEKSLSILIDIGDNNGMAATYNNIGLVYFSLGAADTALVFFNNAALIGEKIGNIITVRSAYNNIGDVYRHYEDYAKASIYYEKTQEINELLSDLKSTAITLNSIGNMYKRQGFYLKAEENLLNSLKISKQTGDKLMTLDNYLQLGALYSKMGKFEKALSYLNQHAELNKTFYNEMQLQLSEIHNKYEQERLNNQMRLIIQEKELQNLKYERNKLVLLGITLSALLLLILSATIYISLKQKNKTNKKLELQNLVIQQQKDELTYEKTKSDTHIINILSQISDKDNKTPIKKGASIDDYKMVEALFKKMHEENINSQLEILKTEVSPHFLFNSLNNLMSLIEENQSVAANYVQQLSHVYHYVLLAKERKLVELKEELDFLKSYAFLLYRRFGENLTFSLDIEPKYLNYYMPPLSLELLVENVVKHNIISKNKPLNVDIYVEKGNLIVKNNIQKKPTKEPSTKIGLNNIEKRYRFLCDKKIEVLETRTSFTVKLPLILLS